MAKQLMHTGRLVKGHKSTSALYVLTMGLKLSVRVLANIFLEIKAPNKYNIFYRICNVSDIVNIAKI
jgi:hypothetical protein